MQTGRFEIREDQLSVVRGELDAARYGCEFGPSAVVSSRAQGHRLRHTREDRVVIETASNRSGEEGKGGQAGRQMRGRSEAPRCWLGAMHTLNRRIEIEVVRRVESWWRCERGARHGAAEHQT